MTPPEPPLWPAPAKLNLFLHITGRRPDGYHQLQTVFQFIGIADTLRFHINQQGRITRRSHHDSIAPQDDLAIKAAKLLQQHTNSGYGADIELRKNLPIGGGLGGGSSDAATVLLVLNRLWRTDLDNQQLATLGAQLGADVPVFIHGRACWAEGIGEQLSDIELPQPHYLVIYPNAAVSTAQIFADRQLTREHTAVTIATFRAGRLGNDCEAVVRRRVKAVDSAMRWLSQYAPARLSGTGGCIFAAMDSAGMAQQAAAECPQDWQCFVTKGYNHSPLHQMLEATYN